MSNATQHKSIGPDGVVSYHHENFCFVFGSNEAGRHGKGAAADARRFYGAQNGIGRGLTGNAYAIPTKDKTITTRALSAIESDVGEFLDFAANDQRHFMVTRLGCGLAGYDDRDIAPLFAEAPFNVWLPRRWQHILGWVEPQELRLIVAGSRAFRDRATLFAKLDTLLSRREPEKVEIVSGNAPDGADPLGEQYALERGLNLVRWPAAWTTFDKPAGPLRNRAMAWYADALALFRKGNTPGSMDMLKTAESEELLIRKYPKVAA